MKYKVGFILGGSYYYTEWLDTLLETNEFTNSAYLEGIHVDRIEDEDGEVI